MAMNINKKSIIFVLLAVIALLFKQQELAYFILSGFAVYAVVLLYKFSKLAFSLNTTNNFNNIPISKYRDTRFVPLVLNRGNVLSISEKDPDLELGYHILWQKQQMMFLSFMKTK